MPTSLRRLLVTLGSALCLGGCGGGTSTTPDASTAAAPLPVAAAAPTAAPAPRTLPLTPLRIMRHEAQFAADAALRSSLLTDRVVTHLEPRTAQTSARDTATAGVDRIPVRLEADTTLSFRLTSGAVATAAILARDGTTVATIVSGQKMALAAGDYVLELTSRDVGEALVFVHARAEATATYVCEISDAPSDAMPAATAVTAFVGYARSGPASARVLTWNDYVAAFGDLDAGSPMSYAVWQFFQGGGAEAVIVRTPSASADDVVAGCGVLEGALFNLLVLPDLPAMSDTDATAVRTRALDLARRVNAFCIFDPPSRVRTVTDLVVWRQGQPELSTRLAAVYFPRLQIMDPLTNSVKVLSPSGAMAGLYAANDAANGVWHAPSGLQLPVGTALGVDLPLTDAENGQMNTFGLNAIRFFTNIGVRCWGARTTGGTAEATYVNIQRLIQYVQNTTVQNTQWTVFEPDTPALWASVTQQLSGFLTSLWAQGGLQGTSASQAYTVICDATNNPPEQRAQGVVGVTILFAPLHPAEFTVLQVLLTAAAPGS